MIRESNDGTSAWGGAAEGDGNENGNGDAGSGRFETHRMDVID
jgi:hypothetical protein